jgi:CheY-like chemotaxis protein
MITSSHFSEVVIVKNSADAALDYLKTISSSEEFPQVIFLDLNMPIKDGFEFMVEFEGFSEEFKNASKIIVLSSSISPDDINRASTNPHVSKYVNKPLSEKYLDAIS